MLPFKVTDLHLKNQTIVVFCFFFLVQKVIVAAFDEELQVIVHTTLTSRTVFCESNFVYVSFERAYLDDLMRQLSSS